MTTFYSIVSFSVLIFVTESNQSTKSLKTSQSKDLIKTRTGLNIDWKDELITSTYTNKRHETIDNLEIIITRHILTDNECNFLNT